MSTDILTAARRSRSVAGVDGWLTTTGRAGAPRILARRRFDAAGNVDTGQWPISLRRATGTPEATLWERVDDAATEIVEQVATSSGFHQHRVTIPRGFGELWATIDFRITARGADDRTRIVGLAHGRDAKIRLGLYARSDTFDVWDHDVADSSAVAGGTFAVGDIWRRAVVYLQAATDAGSDGLCRVWLDGNTDPQTPDIETTHNHPLAGQRLQFGCGSVDAATTFELAEFAVYDRDPLALTPYSSGWAATPLFREIVPPLSAISVSPEPLSAQDGATSGTVIGTLSRTGGHGNGTWDLTGDLGNIATINGTDIELTTTVDTATHDGTTGTISYTGDSAGGSASAITTSLAVTSAMTSLTLSAAAGGPQQSGTLDTTADFQWLRIVPKSSPTLMGQADTHPGAEDVRDMSGWRGIELDPANTAVIRVTSLSGGDEVGTLRWAAGTGTGNGGEDLSGKDVVVVFDVSGHIDLDGPLWFTKGRRWFAGQTAPVDSNGRAGVVIHGVVRSNTDIIMSRRVFDDEIVFEHLTFVDGRILYDSNGNVRDDSESPGGALDIGDKAKRHIGKILCRNCTFLFGYDETVQVRGSNPWPDWRTDNVSFRYCWFGPPMYNERAYKRGYNFFITRAGFRVETNCCFIGGGRTRNPWVQGVATYSAVSTYWYDVNLGIFLNKTSYTLGDEPGMGPYGRYIECISGIMEEGPTFDITVDWMVHPDGGDQPDSLVTYYGRDNEFLGAPDPYDYTQKPYWTLPVEPICEHAWPPIPREDLKQAILDHAGACPAYPNSVLEDKKAAWEQGGAISHRVYVDGPARWPEEWPGQNIVATTSAANVPASPFTVESNGLTALENWLEQEHIAKGGAPYQDFGRWLRFPWGGRVKIETNGAVTFDPVDMPAGESGIVEVTRADGSTVSATCAAV